MTLIMGILNITPDSFSDGGEFMDVDHAVAHALVMARAGAAIIDVGGESTRPGAERIDPAEEQARVLPVVIALCKAGAAVSIDTMNASTALAAVTAGARVVNDVSGGLADADMLDAVATTEATMVLGHWRGPSAQMYESAGYTDVVREVVSELSARCDTAASAGIPPSRVVVDPGIGFGKQAEQNWAVLHGLQRFQAVFPRVLIGTSRKRFLAEALASDAGEDISRSRRDVATAVTSALAAQAGVWGVRVHDVIATRDALQVAQRWEDGRRWTSSTKSR